MLSLSDLEDIASLINCAYDLTLNHDKNEALEVRRIYRGISKVISELKEEKKRSDFGTIAVRLRDTFSVLPPAKTESEERWNDK